MEADTSIPVGLKPLLELLTKCSTVIESLALLDDEELADVKGEEAAEMRTEDVFLRLSFRSWNKLMVRKSEEKKHTQKQRTRWTR